MVMKYDLTLLKAASANRWSESSVSFEPIATLVPMRLKETSSFPALVTTLYRCASTDSGLSASTFETSATPPESEISFAMRFREFSVRPARKTVAPFPGERLCDGGSYSPGGSIDYCDLPVQQLQTLDLLRGCH
jgi:hypothetical protein